MSRTDLVHMLKENLRVGVDMEMEIDRIKEENRKFNSIIKDLESENIKSSERFVTLIRKIEYLNTKIERMKEENKNFKSIVEGGNLKGGERAVAFMKKIQNLTTDLENMKEKRKASEEELRKGRENNFSLVLKMEKMKQRIREREREFKLEMECLNISLQRAKVIGEKRLQEIRDNPTNTSELQQKEVNLKRNRSFLTPRKRRKFFWLFDQKKWQKATKRKRNLKHQQ